MKEMTNDNIFNEYIHTIGMNNIYIEELYQSFKRRLENEDRQHIFREED